MQLETLDATVPTSVNDYIKEIQANYEQQNQQLRTRNKELERVIEELKSNYEKSIKETKEYQYKYLAIKEQAD